MKIKIIFFNYMYKYVCMYIYMCVCVCVCVSHQLNIMVKTIPLQAWGGSYGARRLRLSEFLDNRHMKVARLPALGTGRLYPPRR